MRITSLQLENCKRFRSQRWEFKHDAPQGENLITLILGANGSGKTTILQAIAATVGVACGRLQKGRNIDWPGFDLRLLNSAWQGPYRIEVGVTFEREEIEATREYGKAFAENSEFPNFVLPDTQETVTLVCTDGEVKATTAAQYYQFQGRNYARHLVRNRLVGHDAFDRIGSVFWYTDRRTSTSLTSESDEEIIFDDDKLRDRLSKLAVSHSIRGRRGNGGDLAPDTFQKLEKLYSSFFPRRKFTGPVQRSEQDAVLDEPYFYLTDGVHDYEISEMSGAERALFPIAFDFANWNINNSVILIDEIELHLHPPMQQHFLNELKSLGRNNHFIISTHSDWIVPMFPASRILRLKPEL